MHIKLLITSIALAAVHASPACALGSSRSGIGPNGLKWTATSNIIGHSSTGTSPVQTDPNTRPGGGDPIYLAPNSNGYSGVVGLLITVNDDDFYTCSGTLVGNRSVVTAGHCVSYGGGVKAHDITRTQVFFQDDASSAGDERAFGIPIGNLPPGVTMIDVANYTVNPAYTGETADQNDIAVLTLADFAPAYAKRYEVYTDDIKGKEFNVTGYGVRSSGGGAVGDSGPYGTRSGYRRQGDNVYDFAWGDGTFDGFFTDQPEDGDWYLGGAQVEYSYLADFDNGLGAQDSSCVIARAAGLSGAAADGLGFCTLGLGDLEVNPAGGDSGGGAFIDGKLASVTSYGMNFTLEGYGDFDGQPDNGYGELTGYVPTFLHADFIRNAIAAVPEPATWAQMLLGFGLIGVATRRRPRPACALA
ncbi:PEPxxWA-CTERM sorting domain-containing protein [uncultured Sphingomonas sp.]|uniref:PEPxxWA-CTERM sorting domain-containing protein n=1 Tax=uncultured Sphingomonas sp. TaxID=158754 RepID=UPI0035CA5327